MIRWLCKQVNSLCSIPRILYWIIYQALQGKSDLIFMILFQAILKAYALIGCKIGNSGEWSVDRLVASLLLYCIYTTYSKYSHSLCKVYLAHWFTTYKISWRPSKNHKLWQSEGQWNDLLIKMLFQKLMVCTDWDIYASITFTGSMYLLVGY